MAMPSQMLPLLYLLLVGFLFPWHFPMSWLGNEQVSLSLIAFYSPTQLPQSQRTALLHLELVSRT